MTPPMEIRKVLDLFLLRVEFHWKSKRNLWGRFGGGWDWKMGFQFGDKTLIVSLLIFDIRIEFGRKPKMAVETENSLR